MSREYKLNLALMASSSQQAKQKLHEETPSTIGSTGRSGPHSSRNDERVRDAVVEQDWDQDGCDDDDDGSVIDA